MKIFFKKEIIVIFAFSLLALVARGYSFGTGDQVLYLPLFYRMQDSALFSNDALFPIIWSHYAPFFNVVLFTNSLVNNNFFVSFLLLYTLFNFLFFVGVFLLTKQFSKNELTFWVLSFFFIWHIPIGGSALTTTESVFVPRFIANVGSLFALLFLYQKHFYRLFFLVGLIFFVHPRSAIMILVLFIPALLLNNFKKNFSVTIKGLCIFGIVIVWFLPVFLGELGKNTSFFIPSFSWLATLYLRNAYAFPHLWSGRSWFYLIITLIPPIFFFGQKIYRKSLSFFDRINIGIFSTAFIIFGISFLFTSIFPLTPVISLQLGRIWLIPVWVSFFYTASFVTAMMQKISFPVSAVKIGSIFFLLLIAFFKKDTFIQLQPIDWIETQVWARGHTDKACTFLVDYYSQGFRVYSQRSIVGEYKDGTLSFYSESFAHEWNVRKKYFNPKEDGFYMQYLGEIETKYPFSFVVLHNSIPSNLERIYQNSSYSIYRISNLEQHCTFHI